MRTFDLFISYARQDEQVAQSLQAALEAQGVRCWRDRNNIAPSEYEFPDRICDGLSCSTHFIAILSSSFIASFYCQQEVVNALANAASGVRLLLLDDSLAFHPLVELTTKPFQIVDYESSSVIASWAREENSQISGGPETFLEAAGRFCANRFNAQLSADAANYLRYVVTPMVEREALLHVIQVDQLTEESRELKTVEERLSADQNILPSFSIAALKSALGFAFDRLGDYDRASHYRAQVYAACLEAQGSSGPDTIQSASHLIHSLARGGRRNDAVRLAKMTLDSARTSLGRQDPLTLEAANTLGGVIAEEGNHEQASEIFREVLSGLEAQGLVENSDMMLSASSNLGYSLMRSGNELVAFELLSKVHNMYTIKLGEAHRDTAQAAVKLSECALRVGLFESASMNSIAALRVLDSLAIDHPLRAYAATVAMQCFDQVGNEYQNYRLHKRYVERLFRNGGPRAEEVRAFLEENPDYYPAQDSLPDDEASVFTLWLNIAWDGAVNWGDVDCMCVIGCANMSAEGYYLLDEAVGGRGIKLASSPQPSHWLNRIVTEHPQSPPAKFAASLLDDNHPIQMRRKKSLSVLKRIHEVVPNSAYFGHPMQFGRLPPK